MGSPLGSLASAPYCHRIGAASALQRTAPGGLLIYSTCSIEFEENAGQVAAFLEKHPELTLVSQRQLIPDLDMDGAFAAVMKKKSVC